MGPLVPCVFGLRMTLPMSFKVRVERSSPVLFCLAHNNFQSHLQLLGSGHEPGSPACEANTIKRDIYRP